MKYFVIFVCWVTNVVAQSDICDMPCDTSCDTGDTFTNLQAKNFTEIVSGFKKFSSGSHAVLSYNITTELQGRQVISMQVWFDDSRKIPVASTTYFDVANAEVRVTCARNFQKCQICPGLTADRQNNCQNTYGMTLEQQRYTGYPAFDRGHLIPLRPYMSSVHARDTTCLCVNVAPQDPYTNQVAWRMVEERVLNAFKREGHSAFVITGVCTANNTLSPVTTQGDPVPDCFWKLVCYKEPQRTYVVGYIAENNLTANTVQAKLLRKEQTNLVRSQREVLTRMGANSNFISHFWAQAAVVSNGRPGIASAPSVATCSTTLDLPTEILQVWNNPKE